MGIFSWNNDKGKLVLVFDVGSSSVGGALFWTQESGVPKIVFAVREPIALEEKVESGRFLFLVMKALETVVDRVQAARLGAPAEIFCVLSSLWSTSQTRVIKLEKNTPFIFTPKLALDLIQKEITLFEEEYAKEYKSNKSAFRSIEFKNIKTMLNGYETSKPLDQKVKELEMTIFISISPDQVLKKIEQTIMKHFHIRGIKFSSFALSSFTAVRDTYANQDNFLLIDIGGEITDIFMVKNNILRESISFPLGRNFITREVATISKSSLSEARSLVSLFKDGHATVAMTKKLSPVINKLKAEWLVKFQESLANLSSDISVPSTIYLAVDRDMANFFSETIRTEQFNQYTLTESKFNITFLGLEVFHGMAKFEENTIRDSGLIIDSIYINRFLINHTKTGM